MCTSFFFHRHHDHIYLLIQEVIHAPLHSSCVGLLAAASEEPSNNRPDLSLGGHDRRLVGGSRRVRPRVVRCSRYLCRGSTCSQLLVMVDGTIIIDSYLERLPHIYNIKSSELYALNKEGGGGDVRHVVKRRVVR